MPAAVQRSTICPSRQRVTLQLVVRAMEIIDSPGLGEAGSGNRRLPLAEPESQPAAHSLARSSSSRPNSASSPGNHPGEGVQRVGDPFLVGHNRNSLERRMMLDQGPEAQLEVLDQAAGPEALVVWSHDLDDSDIAGFQEFLHGRLELAQVVTAEAADTRMPVTPSGMSGSTSIIDSPSSSVSDSRRSFVAIQYGF
jgi:hypothetical protein